MIYKLTRFKEGQDLKRDKIYKRARSTKGQDQKKENI